MVSLRPPGMHGSAGGLHAVASAAAVRTGVHVKYGYHKEGHYTIYLHLPRVQASQAPEAHHHGTGQGNTIEQVLLLSPLCIPAAIT